MRRVGDKASVQLTSYECVLRAADYIFDPNHERYLAARDCLTRVTVEEPDYADAWAAWSEICSDGVTVWADETLSLDQSVEFANRAIQIDAEHPHAHWALSYAYFAKEDFDQFLVEADRAIELDPNNSAVVGQLGALIAALGKWDRGIALLDGAIKLNPNYQPWLNYAFIGHHIRLGEYDTALPYARDYVARAPDFHLAHLNIVWTLGLLGRADEAKPYIDQLNTQFPDFRNEVHAIIEPWYFDGMLIARLYEGLRGSGMDVSQPTASP
jgi:tetratricopeptide (TPR) repeat protein